jgi:probable F420-dependent oxidoreductase
VKIGLNLVPVAPGRLVEVARAAEALGYESVWSGEHVALPVDADFSMYPGAEPVFLPDSVFLEPLVALSHIAAATHRIRLGVGILILALRDPLPAGRAIATLDVLSGGRLDLGIGVGWSAEEYRATGRDYATRGRRTDEMIDALDVLFTRGSPEFHGRFFDFPPIGFQPKPVQQPRPRFHIGGFAPAALDRAVTRGDGWYGAARSPEDARPVVAALRAKRAQTARADQPFEITLISLDEPPDRALIEGFADAGVDRIVVTPWRIDGRTPLPGELDDPTPGVERYAAAIELGDA